MDKLDLSIVTPDGEIFSGEVKNVLLPGKEGEFGVLPGHSSLVSSLDVGVIEFETIDNKKEAITINWGYAKVNESSVDVLVDGAVALNISDSSKLKENLQKAKELLKSVSDTNVPLAAVEAKMSSFV